MAGRGRTAKRGTKWFPIDEVEESTLDALAAGGAGALCAVEIEDRGTGNAYTRGAIVSFRLWADVKPEAAIEMMPNLHVFILPAGESIPSIASAAAIKQAEHFHWAQKPFTTMGAIPAADNMWSVFLEITTARRFRQGDKFYVLVHNRDPSVAFGAAAVGSIVVDAYVVTD